MQTADDDHIVVVAQHVVCLVEEEPTHLVHLVVAAEAARMSAASPST